MKLLTKCSSPIRRAALLTAGVWIASAVATTSAQCPPTAPQYITVPPGAQIQQFINQVTVAGAVVCLAPSPYPPQNIFIGPNVPDFILSGTYPLTVLDGGGVGSVITVTGPHTGAMVIQNLVVKGGVGTTIQTPSGLPALAGGGILVRAPARPTLRNLLIEGNTAGVGGGLYVELQTAVPPMRVTRCIFQDNIAFAKGGGAVIAGLQPQPTIPPAPVGQSPGLGVLFNLCTFDINHAPSATVGQAGGLGVTGYARVRADHSWFTSNDTGGRGGAAATFQSNESGDVPILEINECHLWNNNAAFGGGAIDADYARGLSVWDSTFDQNFCTDLNASYGGHIFMHHGQQLTGGYSVQNSLFVGGSAFRGGAIATVDTSCTIQLCTFDTNSAVLEGGAVYADGFGGTVVTLLESILYNDTASVTYFTPSMSTSTIELWAWPGAQFSVDFCDVAVLGVGATPWPSPTPSSNVNVPPLYAAGWSCPWSPLGRFFLDQANNPGIIDGGGFAALGVFNITNPALPGFPDALPRDMGFHYSPPTCP